jgi:CBS domain-containing protein
MREDILEEEQQIAHERAEERLETAMLRRPIRELSTLQPAITLDHTATVREAVEMMKQAQVSCVLIVDQDRLVGVFTEHDILTRVVAQAADVDHMQMREVMSPDPDWLDIDDELVYALNQMYINDYHYVPVVDEEGRPNAVVSMQAIVGYLIDLFPQELLNLPPSAAHSRPRTPEGA